MELKFYNPFEDKILQPTVIFTKIKEEKRFGKTIKPENINPMLMWFPKGETLDILFPKQKEKIFFPIISTPETKEGKYRITFAIHTQTQKFSPTQKTYSFDAQKTRFIPENWNDFHFEVINEVTLEPSLKKFLSLTELDYPVRNLYPRSILGTASGLKVDLFTLDNELQVKIIISGYPSDYTEQDMKSFISSSSRIKPEYLDSKDTKIIKGREYITFKSKPIRVDNREIYLISYLTFIQEEKVQLSLDITTSKKYLSRESELINNLNFKTS